MDVAEAYEELDRLLAKGEAVYVLSQYPQEGVVRRRLLRAQDEVQAQQVAKLLNGPAIRHQGPLALASACRPGGQEDEAPRSSAPVIEAATLERYMACPRLIILGGGHISLALADIAKKLDFKTIVYDDRPSFASTRRFSSADQVICDSFARLGQNIEFGPSDFVVAVTRGHLHDKECLEAVLSGPEPAYTGMIGSSRRVAIVMGQLLAEGFDALRIRRIHAPIGLPIGGVTPAEISISILAQVIEAKRIRHTDNHWLSGDLEAVKAIAAGNIRPDALITVLETTGSVPTEPGCKLAMTYEGQLAGNIGGGCSEAEAMRVARQIINAEKKQESFSRWCFHQIDLTDSAEEDGMVCGGTIKVLVEVV